MHGSIRAGSCGLDVEVASRGAVSHIKDARRWPVNRRVNHTIRGVIRRPRNVVGDSPGEALQLSPIFAGPYMPGTGGGIEVLHIGNAIAIVIAAQYWNAA